MSGPEPKTFLNPQGWDRSLSVWFSITLAFPIKVLQGPFYHLLVARAGFINPAHPEARRGGGVLASQKYEKNPDLLNEGLSKGCSRFHPLTQNTML